MARRRPRARVGSHICIGSMVATRLALLARISSLQARAARGLDATIGVVCCFEAGRDGFWLHRLLTAHGVVCHVLEPTSILVNRRARRAKTDRLDAEGMLRVLAAYLRGDHQACSMVRVPTPEEEDAKRTHREREKLVQERLRIQNRIEALLFTQGIRKRPSLRSWERDLAVLRTGDGREIPRHLRACSGALRAADHWRRSWRRAPQAFVSLNRASFEKACFRHLCDSSRTVPRPAMFASNASPALTRTVGRAPLRARRRRRAAGVCGWPLRQPPRHRIEGIAEARGARSLRGLFLARHLHLQGAEVQAVEATDSTTEDEEPR